ncbi:ComEA family DNA-binding protein [Microterricola pindariensis]|uniref:Helix-hairpin-helix DNA-binding motif class 1 domain-containing protein n=1 Tax=Microterricola pindariensis TaxID=478010 RepID=A0ABX5AUV2_9MICO|nr:ComEA family DNA-binding protein [Microterricola pindariensis]PPL18688.1 hypothetical protein GY24_10095 [Microterricola pindariensis]
MESSTGEPGPPAELAPSARVPSARTRVGVGAAIVLFLVALVAAVLVSAFGSAGADETIPLGEGSIAPSAGALDAPDASGGPDVAEAPLYVHVWGAVADAGLYQVAAGSRVVDVIAAAGGFTDDADPAGVNLARALSDGEQLHVPRVGEVPPPAAVSPGGAGGTSGGAAGADAQPLINLNTATQAELETLPQIGPALAQRILDWRAANGGFDTVEDLRSVTGIGAKTFDGLRDKVTV